MRVLPRYSPMLASTGPITGTMEDWAFEPKLDGWRALVYVDGSLMVRTRNDGDITSSVPELSPLANALTGHHVVLDGELVAQQGRPFDFYRLGPRLAARNTVAVTRGQQRTSISFVAFDLLQLGSDDLTGLPYVARRARLDELNLIGSAWCTVSSFPGAGPDVMAACVELGLEGVVAKRLSSIYRPGARSKDWVKVKCPEWRAVHGPLRHESRDARAATGERRASRPR